MRMILFALILISFSCRNAPDSRERTADVTTTNDEEIKQLQKENQDLKDAAAAAKAAEDNKKKKLIIQQIRQGQGLVITKKHDPIGMGGVNNGSFILENALSGIVFKIVTVTSTVYLANGQVYDVNTYTFTNVSPGDTRTRSIPNTGSRGKTLDVRVTEIQSNWLTNGELLALE